MSSQAQDIDCIRRLETGDSGALEELYDRYTPLLYSLAHRILRSASDAEDAVQNAWVQAWKSAGAYDPHRGTVAAWLLNMTRSRSLDLYRSLASRRRAEEVVDPDALPLPPDPAAGAHHVQLGERVRDALGTLEASQRQVLEIAYFEGLSQSEIAERIGSPLGTVKSWTRQGLLRLRELLPQEEWA